MNRKNGRPMQRNVVQFSGFLQHRTAQFLLIALFDIDHDMIYIFLCHVNRKAISKGSMRIRNRTYYSLWTIFIKSLGFTHSSHRMSNITCESAVTEFRWLIAVYTYNDLAKLQHTAVCDFQVKRRSMTMSTTLKSNSVSYFALDR